MENLLQAWEQFKKGKRNKKDVLCFEWHLEDMLFALQSELATKTYRHGPYSSFYITDPKVRHIHKAQVRDRIVHHALFNVLNPIFEPTFIADSYACRKGYGTHRGFRKLVTKSRKVSKNYSRDCWVLQCDVKKFFDSIDHAILLALIGRWIKDAELMRLLIEVVGSYNVAPGRGIPIGNLTSQLFANIYLNELDRFVKHDLGVAHYLRYADDFMLLCEDKSVLQTALDSIELFLTKSLKLDLHPEKTRSRKLKWGIPFVGYIALPHYELVKTKTKKRIVRKLRQSVFSLKHGDSSEEHFQQSLQLYLGLLSHAHSYNLSQEIQFSIDYWLNE